MHALAQGPTLTMRIHEYSLMRDVLAATARPRQPASMWASPPLVVMNAFDAGREELRLATALFQGLFPAINVQSVRLSSCQARAPCAPCWQRLHARMHREHGFCHAPTCSTTHCHLEGLSIPVPALLAPWACHHRHAAADCWQLEPDLAPGIGACSAWCC
jgi:hypothetical protein